MSDITIIGLDLAKRVFQAHGAFRDGETFSARSSAARNCSRFSQDNLGV